MAVGPSSLSTDELNAYIVARPAAVAAGAAAVTALPATASSAAPALTGDGGSGQRPFEVPDVVVRPEARKDPTEATVAEAVTLLRHRQVSAADLVEAHLDR